MTCTHCDDGQKIPADFVNSGARLPIFSCPKCTACIQHEVIVAALRAGPAATAGSAGAMREALIDGLMLDVSAVFPHPEDQRAVTSLRNCFADRLAAAPQAQEDELYRIRDLIASHIACEKDCQEMPSGCGCALAAARAVVSRPQRGEGG